MTNDQVIKCYHTSKQVLFWFVIYVFRGLICPTVAIDDSIFPLSSFCQHKLKQYPEYRATLPATQNKAPNCTLRNCLGTYERVVFLSGMGDLIDTIRTYVHHCSNKSGWQINMSILTTSVFSDNHKMKDNSETWIQCGRILSVLYFLSAQFLTHFQMPVLFYWEITTVTLCAAKTDSMHVLFFPKPRDLQDPK